MEDKKVFDILTEHFKNIDRMNEILEEVIRLLENHENRIKSLEIKPKKDIVDDEDEDGILIPA